MPTPQPNLASKKLLGKLQSVLKTVIGAIRAWYDAQPAEVQELLVDIKLGEEVDVGANFYYYQDGNQIWRDSPHNASSDPKHGPQWSKGLSGGLPPMGYNMLKTMGLRSSGGPPTRHEITLGVQHYFGALVSACRSVWPDLGLAAGGGGGSQVRVTLWQAGACESLLQNLKNHFCRSSCLAV